MAQRDFDHESRHPPLPGHKEHRCTDVGWLALFIVAIGFVVYIQVWAHVAGKSDTRKLIHGFNYDKKLCGVQTPGDYLYWCKDASNQELVFDLPICVNECPKDSKGTAKCYDKLMGREQKIPTYKTKKRGVYCVPEDAHFARNATAKVLGHGGISKVTDIADAVWQAKVLLGCSLLVAVILGYAYLFLIELAAGPLIKVFMVAMIVGPVCVGAYFLYYVFHPTKDDSGASATGDSQWNLIFGCCGIFIGFVFILVACCFMNGLETAVGCIEASCECLFQEGTLMLEPIISLSGKVFVLVMMLWGIINLLACGEVSMEGKTGMPRSFTWNPEVKGYIFYMLFMLVWMLELGTAMSQYVLAWATQMWYFTPYVDGKKLDVPSCTICKGYVNLFLYHLGTVILGSLLIAILQGLRFVMGLIARSAEAQGNCIGACIAKVCVCFVSFFKNFLEFLNKTAYMDVAIFSEGFCTSASRAMGLMVEEVPVVGILNGAQLVFQIVGMGIISGTPMILVFLICKWIPAFSDEDSVHYIAKPKWVGLAAGLLCAPIGWSFMVVFDTVGDTILYCFATDQRRHSILSNVQAVQKHYASSEEQSEDEDEGFFGWIFGSKERIDDTLQELGSSLMEERVEYAPPRLRQLIEDHAHLVE